MTDFQTLTPTQPALDPRKRINYTFGLVLGVDEFQQEQLYFIEKNRLHNRALHGYGTVCGLRVTPGKDDEIVVSTGIAVNPQGQEIIVDTEQCAHLGAWLKQNQKKVQEKRRSLKLKDTDPLPVYVTLCYRECPTDDVPIPGEPCRTPQDSIAPSRIEENFRLAFALDAPTQLEEEAVVRFGTLLRRLEITDDAADYAKKEEFYDLIRKLKDRSTKPPDMAPIVLKDTEDITAILREGFRIWVTEVRPALLDEEGKDRNCACGPTDEQCILLAQVNLSSNFDPEGGTQIDAKMIDDSKRPYLLHTRLLQEWLMYGRSFDKESDSTFATAYAIDPNTVRLWIHYEKAFKVTEKDPFTLKINDQEVKIKGIKQAEGLGYLFDITFEAEKLLQQQDRITVVIKLDQLVETDSGESIASALNRQADNYLDREGSEIAIYGIAILPYLNDLLDVNASNRNNGDVLTWNGKQWVPQPVQAGATDNSQVMGMVTLTFERTKVEGEAPSVSEFKAWFHLNNDTNPNETNLPLIKDIPPVRVLRETNNPAPFTEILHANVRVDPNQRNVFLISVDNTHPGDYLRFIFPLGEIKIIDSQGNQTSLLDYTRVHRLKWIGFDGKADVTEFLELPLAQAAAPGSMNVVAAGFFNIHQIDNGNLQPIGPTFNHTAAKIADPASNSIFLVTFDNYQSNSTYIVKGTPVIANAEFKEVHTFEVIYMSQARVAEARPVEGILVRVTGTDNQPPDGFMIEVSEIRGQ